MKIKGKRSDYHSNTRGKETTRDERLRVIALRSVEQKFSDIANQVGLSESCCRMIWRRWCTTHSPSNRDRTGRPTIFDDRLKRQLEQFVTSSAGTRRLSWEEIIQEMQLPCSVATVRQAMASLGYNKRLPLKDFVVSDVNRAKRVQWCQDRLHWTYDDWARVIWTDESSFSTAAFPHRRRSWVIRKPADEYHHSDGVDPLLHHSCGRQSTLVFWGAFCGTTKTDLTFLPGNAKLDPGMYTARVLEPVLVPFWHRMCEEHGWAMVVQDGASGHQGVARECRDAHQLDCVPWPPQSPDLNLIDVLWGDLEAELGIIFGRAAEDVEELQADCRVVWNTLFTEDRLKALVESMPRRLEAVIAAGGAATAY